LYPNHKKKKIEAMNTCPDGLLRKAGSSPPSGRRHIPKTARRTPLCHPRTSSTTVSK